MVQYYDSISDDLRDWALQQQVFFIASAPLTGKHVNLSPKGLPASTLTVFDPNHVGYIDATGSGIETISHMYENGRATIMFCSFDQSPRIMRWFSKGRVVEWDDPEFDKWLGRMGKERITGARAIILFDVWKVQTSCGYAVPIVSSSVDQAKVDQGPRAYLDDRKTLGHWASKQVEKGTLNEYQQKWNSRSLDDCAGLRAARKARGENILLEDMLIWLRRTSSQRDAMILGGILAITMLGLLNVTLQMLGLNLSSSLRILV